jgi:PAS domain S-box-containing protein
MAESRVESKSVSNGVVVDLTEKKPIPVLQVDDDSAFLKVAKQCLEMQGGFQVDPALSASEAVEKMKTKTYDVIICDYDMPEKDGLEFLKELRDSGNSIPFIMFTGKGRGEVTIKAFNFGADRYFNKIGAPETVYGELAHGIRQVVESKRGEEALRESENYLKAILASIVTGVIVIDAETHEIVDANSKALETIGASREHVIGKVCHKFICLGEKGKCPISDLGQTEDRSERVLLRADGGRIPILKTVVTMTWKGRKYMVESFVDITERKRAERALLESQEKFERFFVNSPEAGVYVDSNFHILDANPRFSELFGYYLDEIKGKRLLDLLVPEDKKDEGEMLDRKAKEAYTYGDAVRKRKDGTLVTVSISAAPITVEGQPVGYVGLYRDVTERKHYENSLSALNSYSRNLNMAKTMEEIYELTLDAAEKTLGFEFADVFMVEGKILHLVTHRGKTKISSLRLPLDGDKGITVRAAKTGKPVLVPDISKEEAYVEGEEGARSELIVPIKIGPRVLGVLNVESRKLNAFNEKDQELLEILASHAATAISKLEYSKSLETYTQQIRENQQKFERLFMDNPEAAVYLDPNFHILDVNPRFTKLFGFSLDEVKGKHIDDVVVPKDKIEEAKTLGREFMKGYTYHDTIRKRKDGSLVPVAISGGPLTIEGKIIGTLALYMDITERKHYETSLSALNSYSRNLNMAKTMEEIYELTLHAAEKTLKFEYTDVLIVEGKTLHLKTSRGRSSSSINLPMGGDRGITVRAAKTGKPVLVPDISKDEAYVEFGENMASELAVPIKIGDKVLGVLNVESKRLNAFDEKDQGLLEILASHAATAMSKLEYSKSLETYAQEIQKSQQKFERLFTDNPEAAVHTDSSFHILDVNPRFAKLFGYPLDEIKGKHINDVIVPKDKMEEAVVFDERASKGEIYHEDTVRKRKDGSLVPVAFSAAPIIVENQVIGHIAVYKDISQLKKTEEELRQTLEKLAKTNEKLRVIGGLTRHDARNKLGVITGNAYLAGKKLGGNDEVLNNLKEMEVAVGQIVRIFDFAKTYEMLGIEELRYIDAEKMVNEAVSLFSDLKGVRVINNCRGLTVLADSLLRQLFYNLVDNSLKYGEKIKTITMFYEEIDKDKLKLVYEDDGVGIAEAEKKKLFQEGYGRGTGYGLYLIRKMCEGYGWNIQETGKMGEGAQFTITIPRIGEKGETNYSINQPAIM